MADVKVSALPAVVTAAGTDEIPINQAGTSKKLTAAQNKAFVLTSIGQNVSFDADNTRDVGSSSTRAANVYATNLRAGTSGVVRVARTTTPSGASNVAALVNDGTGESTAIFSSNNASNDANPTGNTLIETGNKTSGTGDSGDINLLTGTSAGGSRGDISLDAAAVQISAAVGEAGLFGTHIRVQALADNAAEIEVHATGFSTTVSATASILIITPAGTLATGTITFPTTEVEGKVLRISSTQIITSLTFVAGAGDTFSNAPTTITAGGSYGFIHIGTVWYPYA